MPDPTSALDDFALASRTTPVADLIRAEIAERGRITFERFMGLALYHPVYGYYSREHFAWGAAGDFETSPEVHPIFGYLWARQVLECWERLGQPRVFHLVEPGAGSGAFAAAILTWLRERAPNCARAVQPILLDGHPYRVADQQRALAAHGIEATHALLDDWLPQGEPLTGVVISNELFDALPVHLIERRDGVLCEWYVTSAGSGGGFVLELGPPSTPAIEAHFEALGVWPGERCRAEISVAAPALMARLAARVQRGYILTIDYGYDAATLYAPWRRMGTLMAFRNHSPQPSPLALPGLTDLTAHVDLTSLASSAAAEGFEAVPPTSQAEALVALGIGEALEAARQRAAADFAGYAAARRAAETLLDPTGLGRIRVLAMAKDAPLAGLRCLEAMSR